MMIVVTKIILASHRNSALEIHALICYILERKTLSVLVRPFIDKVNLWLINRSQYKLFLMKLSHSDSCVIYS